MDINGMDYYVQRAKPEEFHIQTELQILFLLEGEMTIKYLDEKYQMKQEDVILINPGVGYEVNDTGEALYGAAVFSLTMMNQAIQNQNMIFYCNSVVDTRHSYQELREIFFRLTAEYTSRSHQTKCYRDSLLLKLLDCLVEGYQVDSRSMMTGENENDARMRQIMQYVMANINQELSLHELADQMFVSASTLSRIFKKNTGVYFADYVMQLRIQSSLGLLEHSEQNMTQIAMNSGFTNSASFNRTFRKIMGITPTEYRELHWKRQFKNEAKNQEKEIRDELLEKGYGTGKQERTTEISLDTESNINGIFRKPWNLMINIGPAWDLNNANVQFHTLYLKEQLHFQYIRIWNIFSKKMMITDGETTGQYNYDVVNQILDFLVKNQLKPFLNLGRRPNTARRSDGQNVFYEEQYIPFATRKSWEAMMDDFFLHIVSRYGLDEVSEWIFELDREYVAEEKVPEYGLYLDEQYDFFDAWKYLYQRVKARIPKAKIGGVSSIIVKDKVFLAGFLRRCTKEHVTPDFVSFIIFSHTNNQSGRICSEKQANYSEKNQMHEIRKMLQQTGTEKIPIYITEWNNTISNRNYLNDSCFRGAYLVDRIASVLGDVDMLGIMSGSDWVSSHIDTVGIINGGIGLLTKDTIRKPAFFAVGFLNRLGEYLLDKGKYYIATRKKNGDIYILCFYFAWFQRSYLLQEENADLQKCNSMVFEDEYSIHLEIHLENLKESGKYYVKKRTINEENGSILNEWGKFQYDVHLIREDVKYLQDISFPSLSQSRETVIDEDRTLDLHVVLKPQEISLIHIFCRK